MQEIIEGALAASAPGGSTHDYFLANRKWEAKMRGDFAALREASGADIGAIRDEGIVLLRRLSRDYRTRHPPAALPGLYDDGMEALRERGWLRQKPPPLLAGGEPETEKIAAAVVQILQRCAQRGDRRPYSLATKWLHFLFPDTFAIYDIQAAAAIQRWSDAALADLRPRDPARRQYRIQPICWTTGTGYIGVLSFYRRLWEAAEQQGLAADLESAAGRLEQLAREPPGDPRARVSVLDVVDKYLWKAMP